MEETKKGGICRRAGKRQNFQNMTNRHTYRQTIWRVRKKECCVSLRGRKRDGRGTLGIEQKQNKWKIRTQNPRERLVLNRPKCQLVTRQRKAFAWFLWWFRLRARSLVIYIFVNSSHHRHYLDLYVGIEGDNQVFTGLCNIFPRCMIHQRPQYYKINCLPFNRFPTEKKKRIWTKFK